MDEFWTKQYGVLTISRQLLQDLGFARWQIDSLTDEDMERIAASLAATYPDFRERVKLNVRMYLLK